MIKYFLHSKLTSLISFYLIIQINSGLAQEAIRLKDTISSGTGVINLFKGHKNQVLTGATLEQYRQSNNGYLTFAVDINEAASGSEKASSQGVAIDTLSIDFVISGETISVTDFQTETQSVLARAGQSSRTSYYTLIGRTGSNNINGSKLDGTSFDATLSIAVDFSLSELESVTMNISLLDTNSTLGDPETFYDYSAGFEDLALINTADAAFLNTQAVGREEAPLVVLSEEIAKTVASLYSPSSDQYYIVAYEDQYPETGDYDLNDLVVAYRVTFGLNVNGEVKTINAEGYLVARGGIYDHDWHLRIPLENDARSIGQFALYDSEITPEDADILKNIDVSDDLDITVFSNTLSLFVDPGSSYVNTLPDSSEIVGDKFQFSITLENAQPLDKIGEAPFDPYLFVNSTGYEIHLPNKAPVHPSSVNLSEGWSNFTNRDGYPFAFIFPETWRNPLEKVDVGQAYPMLIDYIISNKESHKDWYLYGDSAQLGTISQEKWEW